MNDKAHYILPNWPAPKWVKAFSTTRKGGFSNVPYDSFNIGMGTEDNPENVKANRKKLAEDLNLPSDPVWLKQVHGNIAVSAEQTIPYTSADASYTQEKNIVCVVLTADCLPVLIANKQGTKVAAIHSGWRGLSAGVIETTLQAMQIEPMEAMAWLGPAIGPETFEVGDEVREIFIKHHVDAAGAFKSHGNKWLANIYQLAQLRLKNYGITQIYSNDYCTFRDKELFFSHRRDKGKTGRMATLIWMES